MTAAQFKTRWPEFTPVPDPHVEAVLTEIELEVSDGWGTRRDHVVGLKTAHRLAISPEGRNARLSPEKGNGDFGSTVYGVEYVALARSRAWANGLRLSHGV